MKNNSLLKFLISIGTLLITGYLLPGFTIDNLLAAVLAAIVIAIVNSILKPIMLLIALPINFLTFGLFSLVINGFLIWFSSLIVPGFTIDGFWPAVLGAIVMALVGGLLNSILVSNKDEN